MIVTIPELASIPAWLATPAGRVAAIHDELAASLGPAWRAVASTTAIEVARAHWSEWTAADLLDRYAALGTPERHAGPGLLHEPSGIVLRVIPGGELAMGMSDEETELLLGEAAHAADPYQELEYLDGQRPTMRPV